MKNPFSVRRLSTFFNNAFSRLMAPSERGRNALLKMPREQLRRLSSAEKEVKGLSAGAAHLVPKSIKTVVARTTTVPVAAYNDAVAGVPHTRAAAERKAGLRGYGTAAAEEQAGKTRETRRKFREQISEPQYDGVQYWKAHYFNSEGLQRSKNFSGKSLALMHQYRDAVDHAMFTGDGSGLQKFRRVILTHEGEPIFVSTNLRQIQKALKNDFVRTRLHADINYRHITALGEAA
jgi:hypothetical protein